MKLKLKNTVLKKSKPQNVAKFDVGGAINQTVPALGIPYIATASEVANLPAIEQVQATKLAAEQKLAEERAKFIPSAETEKEYFEKAKGLNKDVADLYDQYKTEREKFYTRVQTEPNENWVFTPEGRQSFRRLMGMLSFDKLNELQNNKTQFDDELKKAREQNTLNDIFYDQGNIYVQNPQTEQVIGMDASRFAAEKEKPGSILAGINPMTIGEYSQYVNTHKGSKEGIPTFGAQMSYQKALDELIAIFDKTASSSYEVVSDALTSMGISEQEVPTMATTLRKRENNSAQLLAAFNSVKDRMSVVAQEAIKAQLLKKGINPDLSDAMISRLAQAEKQKRMQSNNADRTSLNPMLSAVDFSSGSGKNGGISLNATYVEGDFTEHNFNDASWREFRLDAENETPFVGISPTYFVDPTQIQKAVTVQGGKAWKIGGGKATGEDGKPVPMSVINNALEDKPKIGFVFTGQEFTGNPADPKSIKMSTNEKYKGSLVFSGDKAPTKEKGLAAGKIQTMNLNGKEIQFFYDTNEEKYRIVSQRGFRVFRLLDDENKPKNEQVVIEVTPSQSYTFFGTVKKSGTATTKNFFTQGFVPTNQAVDTMYRLKANAQSGTISNEEAAIYKRLLKGLQTIDSTTDQEKKALGKQMVNEAFTDYAAYLEMGHLESQTPKLKPTVAPKSVDIRTGF